MTSHEQPVLFEVTSPPVAQPRPRPTPTAVRWVAVRKRTRPDKCDHCRMALLENDGHGPLARVTTQRRIATDGTDLMLCRAHAEPLRQADRANKRAA